MGEDDKVARGTSGEKALTPNEKARREVKRLQLDIYIILITLCLFGILALYSSLAHLPPAEATTMLMKQVIFYAIGWGIVLFLSKASPDEILRMVPGFTILTLFLLILPFTPLGFSAGGSRAWVKLGPINFQPSELAKVAIILFTAYFTTRKSKWLEDYRKGFIPTLIVLLSYLFLIELEPDLGNAMIITAIFLATMYAGGTKLKYLMGLVSAFSVVFAILIRMKPYRMKRITAFLNPWKDPYDTGYNIIQSLIAHGRGGIWGVGLGNSIQKLHYLPEHHTDFIFSIIGEELGLLGTLGVALLYLALFLIAVKISLRARNKFVKMVAFGIGFAISVQALINMGMTVSMFPITGITLPLISYGGTSVIVTMIMAGLLINFVKHAWEEVEEVER